MIGRAAVAAALVLCVAASVHAATPQEQVEARRQQNPKVIVHVISGETLKGSIERTAKDEFYLADDGGLDRILVPYFAVKGLVDPDTGGAIPFDTPKEPLSTTAAAAAARPAPTPPAPREASRMPLLGLLAAGGIGLIWFAVSRSRS